MENGLCGSVFSSTLRWFCGCCPPYLSRHLESDLFLRNSWFWYACLLFSLLFKKRFFFVRKDVLMQLFPLWKKPPKTQKPLYRLWLIRGSVEDGSWNHVLCTSWMLSIYFEGCTHAHGRLEVCCKSSPRGSGNRLLQTATSTLTCGNPIVLAQRKVLLQRAVSITPLAICKDVEKWRERRPSHHIIHLSRPNPAIRAEVRVCIASFGSNVVLFSSESDYRDVCQHGSTSGVAVWRQQAGQWVLVSHRETGY